MSIDSANSLLVAVAVCCQMRDVVAFEVNQKQDRKMCCDEEFEPDELLYHQARKAMVEGRFEEAVRLFESSIYLYPHFKSLECLGECLSRLNRWKAAIVPLAAATALTRGVRAPSILAEALLQAGYFPDAIDAADIALSRESNNRRAKEVKSKAQELRRQELANGPVPPESSAWGEPSGGDQ